MRRNTSLSCFALLLIATAAIAQVQTSSDTTSNSWQHFDPGFRAIGIASHDSTFWACGVGESIASSTDGRTWNIKNHKATGGATLLGIGFASDTFGYAYGTGGTLLTTEDGGTTWISHQLSENTVLLASLTAPNRGIFRTSDALYSLDGTESPKQISEPSGALKRLPYTTSLAAVSPEKMGVLLSEGKFSGTGILTTTDAGKTWTLYSPPSTRIISFLGIDGRYWATGFEVVDKDKPGGGHSVPLAITSEDGVHWSHSSNEFKPCHWESCGLCTTAGCLASGTLLVNFFQPTTTYSSIPEGALTAKWASASGRICTIHDGISCSNLGTPKDVQAAPLVPKPSEQSVPPLNAKVPAANSLRCLSCSVEPIYVDDKIQGRFTVHIALMIRPDGTIETATVEKAPSASVQQKIQAQLTEWLFEPPQRDGKPVRVSTQSDLPINVVRSR